MSHLMNWYCSNHTKLGQRQQIAALELDGIQLSVLLWDSSAGWIVANMTLAGKIFRKLFVTLGAMLDIQTLSCVILLGNISTGADILLIYTNMITLLQMLLSCN